MAKEENTQEVENMDVAAEAPKPTGTETEVADATAQEPGKTNEGDSMDSPTQDDIANVIAILNAIQKDSGGKGEISTIPPELVSVVKFVLDKMIALRDAFEDPLLKAVIDDMVDQREDGATPSLAVAVARNVPLQELMDLADNEDYAGAQKNLSGKLSADKDAAAENERLSMNFDKTKENFDTYCKNNNYSEDEKSGLWEKVAMLMRVFGDGLLTVEEFAEVDKMRNYDSDVAAIKAQIPTGNKKEVLPDKASIDTAIYPGAQKPAYKPRNQIESMAMNQPSVDVTEIGKRKRSPRIV